MRTRDTLEHYGKKTILTDQSVNKYHDVPVNKILVHCKYLRNQTFILRLKSDSESALSKTLDYTIFRFNRKGFPLCTDWFYQSQSVSYLSIFKNRVIFKNKNTWFGWASADLMSICLLVFSKNVTLLFQILIEKLCKPYDFSSNFVCTFLMQLKNFIKFHYDICGQDYYVLVSQISSVKFFLPI